MRPDRRTVLRGFGTALALPWMESLHREDPEPPTRLAYVYAPNGIHMPAFTPETAGPEWEKTPILVPLERHREDIHLISGLANMAGAPLSGAPRAARSSR